MKKNFTLLAFLLLAKFSFSLDYYWVGGSGNWSDINHWATTSGGTVLQNVVPFPTDNVIFDANSGFTAGSKTVTVDVTANCLNMTWTGAPNNPILDGANDVNIYGSLVMQAGMTWNPNVNFLSDIAGQTITSNTVVFNQRVTFNGNGSWILQDPFNQVTIGFSFVTIDLTKGTLNTNNQPVHINRFIKSGSAVTNLVLGSSIVDVANTGETGSDVWIYNTANSAISAGTSLIRMNGVSATFLATAGQQYNDLNFTNTIGTALISGSAGFHNVSFASNGNINGSNTFNNMDFAPAHTFTLQSGSTQTINGVWQASTPACSGLTLIQSSSAGSQATVSMPVTATVTISYAQIRDINAIGGATFNATNSLDLGNNTGWTFTSLTAQTLFWVGGTGNWNDASHWATISGGTGGCVPTLLDNVVFDANSGFTAGSKTVTVDVPGGYCHNMTWTGAPNNPILGGANDVNIYGSLVMQTGMTWNANVNFLSDNAGETITSNGVVFNQRITFNGNGSWILQDPFNQLNISFSFVTVDLTKGTLNTNNQPVNINRFIKSGNAVTNLVLGSSIVDVANTGETGSDVWIYNTANSGVSAGTSLIRMNGTGATFLALPGQQYNDLSFTNTAGTPLLTGSADFHNVSFASNGNINGNNTFNNLSFAPAHTYTLQSGSIQTINGVWLSTTPACSGLTLIQSSSAGSQATVSMPVTATVTISYAQIKDINATGGATFNATNSIDLGNNTGWTFTSPTAQTLFWVGGTGNWNDASHWATISGGTGGCVPTLLDNVVFDANSGFTAGSKTVTVNVPGAFCHNMNWTAAPNNPILNGPDDVNIYGSLVMQTGMTWNPNVNFLSDNAGETITTNAVVFNQRITFNGNGSWILQDPFNQVSIGSSFVAVDLTKGTLNTNNQPIHINRFVKSGNAVTNLVLGSSIIDVALEGGTGADVWTYASANSGLIAGSSLIRLNGSNANLVGLAGQSYHDLSFTNTAGTAGLAGSVSFHSTVTFASDGDINGSNTFDTLVWSAGKTYTLQAGETQTVNLRLYASGNPCFLLFVQSSSAGTRADLCVNAGPTTTDYVSIKDINASCQTLNALGHSIDAGNNNNWTFAPATTDPISGLGKDTTFSACDPTPFPYTIVTDEFFPSPSTTFLWNDGSTGSSLIVSDTGYYFVTVNYGISCTVRDTIHLQANPLPQLQANALVDCAAATVTLSAITPITNAVYRLDAVTPTGLFPTPQTQSSNVFTLPGTTEGTFTIIDTSGCASVSVNYVYPCSFPLPVTIEWIRGKDEGCSATIEMKIGAEEQINFYELQQSFDGIHFAAADTLHPKGAESLYQFNSLQDKSLAYYRVRIINQDGKVEYSKIVPVNSSCDRITELFQVYPNPSANNANLSVRFKSPVSGEARLMVTDVQGGTVLSKQISTITGLNQLSFSVNALSTGTYSVRIASHGWTSKTVKILITH